MKKIKRKNIVIVIAIVLFLAAGLLVINKPSYSAQPLENICAENIMLVAANEEIYLEGKNNLDDFTFNKTLQKMIESYRITAEQKAVLKAMKRKTNRKVKK